MIICDTSVWIEYFRGRRPYLEKVGAYLERLEVLGMECIFGELLQGAKGRQERSTIFKYWEVIPKMSEAGLWLEAGEYSAVQGLPSKGVGLIDAAIAVCTLKTEASLWTLDSKLSLLVPKKYLLST